MYILGYLVFKIIKNFLFRQKSVVPGMEVFYAPRTEHTAFVFVEQVHLVFCWLLAMIMT